MRLHVDRERCCGSGMCALTAPEVFDQDSGDGRVVLLQTVPSPADRDSARQAVDTCPSGAIEEMTGDAS